LNNNSNVQSFVIANQLNVSVNSPSTCAGSAVTLSATGANNYNWGTNGTGSTISVTPSITTVYSFTASNSNCSVVRTATVNTQSGPSMTVTNASACAGFTVNLTATGATTYSWSNGATTSAITPSATVTTIFTVTGNSGGPCSAVRLATLSIQPSPTLAVNNATVCPGVSASLSASGASTYSWSNGANTPTIIVTPATSTVYVLNAQLGNCISTRNVSVTLGPGLGLFVSPAQATVCSGSSVTLNASGATTYTWSNAVTAPSIVVTPTVTTTYSLAGMALACTGATVVTVVVNSLPQTVVSATNSSCFGNNNGQASASSAGNGPFTYSYSSGATSLGPGIYTVTTTDAKGCKSSTSFAVTEPPAIVTSGTGSITTCPNACDASGQIVISGGTAPYTSTVFPGGFVGQTFTDLCAGNFTYYLTDANGCAGFGVFSVAAGDIGIQVSTSSSNLSCSSCSDGSATAVGAGGTAPYSYTWTPGNYFHSSILDMPAGCYTVNVKDAKGCTAETEVCLSFDTGIHQHLLNGRIKVAPNPSSGIFHVTGLSAKAQVIVYDARGRLIKAMLADSTVEIDLRGNAEGIYFARILNGDEQLVLQLVKY
jgi:hypothetical protein